MKKIRIFHIDDHKLFSQGIYSLLRDEPQVEWLGSATTMAEGLTQCRQLKPDMVLLDYFLPDGNGLMAANLLMNDLPTVQMILLTMENSPTIIDKCQQMGLGGCLQKTIGKDELMSAIRKVLDHQPVFPMPNPKMAKMQQDPLHNISRREREIAFLVAQGLTSNEIAEKLNLSMLTVTTHRRNLMRKLDIKNMAQLVALVTGWGNREGG
ncbi:MAG TPA: response regulator transcription factor [Phnomibacter sp.]|nr:response regulator transcription factor [Phnomibacter sp.]